MMPQKMWKHSCEEYEDVWKNVTATDLAAAINVALVESQDQELLSGRTFLPVRKISVRSALISAVPEGARAAAVRALNDELPGLEEALAQFTPAPPEPTVSCYVSSSMVSGSWGILEFRLCGRGYLYYRPDFGVGDDESLPILGAWEPEDNLAARRACVLKVYEREWNERTLPPAMGEWAVGDPELLQEAILRVLRAHPWAWGSVFERLMEAPEPGEAAHDTLTQVCKLSGAPASRVRKVLHFVSDADDHLRHAVCRKRPNEEVQRVVVALLVHCLAADGTANRNR
jgi:hypothetical protein